MKMSENSVVILSDTDEECEDNEVVLINRRKTVANIEEEIPVITLDDSLTQTRSSLTFTIDSTPDFIPLNVPSYNSKKVRKRKWGTSSSDSVMDKRCECDAEGLANSSSIEITGKVVKKRKTKRKKCVNKQQFRVNEPVVSSTSVNPINLEDAVETDNKKLRIPRIQLSHTNILNTIENKVTKGLRPIIIDGCNVGFGFGIGEFSFQGIIYVVQYFKERKHEEIVCFLPQNYRNRAKTESINKIIKDYEKENIIVYTPTRYLNGKLIKPYDDRFIVQYASEREGVIISNDGYADLINEEPSWRTTIEKRIVNFTFARGLLMLPKDPLGPKGPTLDEMLKFP